MTKHDIAYLACRILAIYCLFLSLQLSWMALSGLTFLGAPSFLSFVSALAWCLPFLLTLIFSVVLWQQSEKLAGWIFPAGEAAAVVTTLDAHTVRAVAFSIMGMLLLLKAIPEAVQMIVSGVMLSRLPNAPEGPRVMASTVGQLLSLVVMVGLGIWLIVGAKGISAWIERLQNKRAASHEDKEQDSSSQ